MSEETDKLRTTINRAMETTNALCNGAKFMMHIPPKPDDTDTLIYDGLRAGKEALDQLDVMEAKIKSVHKLIGEIDKWFFAYNGETPQWIPAYVDMRVLFQQGGPQ